MAKLISCQLWLQFKLLWLSSWNGDTKWKVLTKLYLIFFTTWKVTNCLSPSNNRCQTLFNGQLKEKFRLRIFNLYISIYSQTWAKYLWITTTCQQRPPFWSLNVSYFITYSNLWTKTTYQQQPQIRGTKGGCCRQVRRFDCTCRWWSCRRQCTWWLSRSWRSRRPSWWCWRRTGRCNC